MDVFLFTDRQGFCNHFATAEVLLLRSIGIPARMTIGFAEGEYQEDSGLYVVRIKDTHAWPEVYFVDYGWVIFEPTTNQEPLVYEESPSGNEQLLENGLGGGPESFQSTPEPEQNATPSAADMPLKRLPFRSTQRIFPLLILILVETGGFALIFLLLIKLPERSTSMASIMESSMKLSGIKPPQWLTRWSAYLKRLPMEQAFLVPDMLFGLLKLPANPTQTVRERVELWVNILPEVRPFSIVLLREFEKDLYSEESGNYPLASHASRMINRKIVRAVVFQLLHIKDKRRL
jgi:hypothetical protein